MGEISEALKRAQLKLADAATSRPAARTSPAPLELRDGGEAEQVTIDTQTPEPARVVLAKPKGPAAEEYRHAAVRVLRAMRERNAHSLVVTSPMLGDGKTTTACNLAFALTSVAGGKRIVLIDLDLRRPSVARVLGVKPSQRITDIVNGRVDVARACQRTQFSELDLLLCRSGENALEVIPNPALDGLIVELKRHYDILLIDAPPVLPVPDVSILLPRIDAMLLVARGGRTRRGPLRAALDALGEGKLIGTFLNQSRALFTHRYGYEYSATASSEGSS